MNLKQKPADSFPLCSAQGIFPKLNCEPWCRGEKKRPQENKETEHKKKKDSNLLPGTGEKLKR